MLPDDVAVADAATLGVAGLTALRLLRSAGSVAGQRVLLTGASGGVGHFVAELAAAQGALVTAVSRLGAARRAAAGAGRGRRS